MTVEARVGDLAAFIGAQGDLNLISAQWVIICKSNVMRVKMTSISGVLIMFDNNFAIQVVHNTPMSLRGRSPKQSQVTIKHEIALAGERRLAMTYITQTIPSLCRFHSLASPLHLWCCKDRSWRGKMREYQTSRARVGRNGDPHGWRSLPDRGSAPHHADERRRTGRMPR